MSTRITRKPVKGMIYVSLLAQVFVIFGLVFIPKALVDNARERELHRIGSVADAQIVAEERYTERTWTRVFLDSDGFSELFEVKDEPFAPDSRRTRYRYQLNVDGFRFTLRNRPGTERLRTGSELTIIYDPENIDDFRLYTGAPDLKTGLLLIAIGLFTIGAVGLALLIRFKLWR